MLPHVIRFALSQRFMTLVLALLLAGGGVWAFRELPIDAYPEISTTQVQVIVKAPGMGPLEVEQRITRPIETEVRGIPHQTMLRSITKYALAVVTIDFEDGTDIYWARQQINERIGQVLSKLPAGVEGGLAPITSPLSEVFMFMVEGPGYSNRALRSILDWMIRPRLLPVDGVADVNALGGEVKSFQVQPKPKALESYGLTIGDIIRAIRANNGNAGGDRIVRNNEVLLVRTLGQLRTQRDLAELTVASRKGVPVRLEEVASVGPGAMTRFGGVTRDGKGEAVQGLVLLRTGANGREGHRDGFFSTDLSAASSIQVVFRPALELHTNIYGMMVALLGTGTAGAIAYGDQVPVFFNDRGEDSPVHLLPASAKLIAIEI